VGTTVPSGQEYRAGYVQLPLGGARSVNIFTCLGMFPNQNFEFIFSLLSFLKTRKEVYEITMAVSSISFLEPDDRFLRIYA
jgi:hypothetical protein